ncbi:MAG: Rpn family recombination-promoting nuclease/putative transposase [Agathobacter sp.]|nr:Rpn family recombination-promoting nuclease/putative transposase [Agathobacter sp.]
MGQKDISEKILVDYNDVFADIINVCVYDGEEVVKPEGLENALVHAQYKAEDGRLREEERDVAKYWKKKNIAIALYGIENQVKVDTNMPFRMIGYDGASYRGQLLDKRKSIVPVVSFVLYFGTEERWNKYMSIKECIEIPKDLDNYVNDYQIHVIEVAWLSDEQLAMFRSDFGIVANFFVQKRKNKAYIPNDEREIEHVDEVLKLLAVMSGDQKYERILYNKTGEVKTMCEVADRLFNQGMQQGIQSAVNMLRKLGKNDEEIIALITEEYKLDTEEAKQYL